MSFFRKITSYHVGTVPSLKSFAHGVFSAKAQVLRPARGRTRQNGSRLAGKRRLRSLGPRVEAFKHWGHCRLTENMLSIYLSIYLPIYLYIHVYVCIYIYIYIIFGCHCSRSTFSMCIYIYIRILKVFRLQWQPNPITVPCCRFLSAKPGAPF